MDDTTTDGHVSEPNYQEQALIYAAFTFWLVLTLLVAGGLHRLWSQLVKSEWLNWALLPGTVVSEMSYMFGCLITGGEVRRAKLVQLPEFSKPKRRRVVGDSEPRAQTAPRFRAIGPIDGVLVSMIACSAAVVLLAWWIGKGVLVTFINDDGLLPAAMLPKALPTSWGLFWDQLSLQVTLLRRMSETWGRLDWLDWPVPLFVYLSICLSVRLAPVNRPVRTMLLAAVVLAGVICVVGALTGGSGGGLMRRLWPVLTYVWTTLLFLLAATLAVKGAVALCSAVIAEHPD